MRGKWEVIEGVVDSGAVDTVTNKSTTKFIPIHETKRSKRGAFWTTADGNHVYNEGEKFIEGFTGQGTPTCMPMQIGDVSTTLFSVRRMKEAGNLVVFGLKEELAVVNWKTGKTLCKGGDNVIIDENSGVTTNIDDNGKEYTMKIWVKVPEMEEEKGNEVATKGKKGKGKGKGEHNHIKQPFHWQPYVKRRCKSTDFRIPQ